MHEENPDPVDFPCQTIISGEDLSQTKELYALGWDPEQIRSPDWYGHRDVWVPAYVLGFRRMFVGVNVEV